MALLFIIILLMMGGNYRGVTLDKIKGSVSSDTQNSSTIDLSKKESEKSSFVEDKSND